MNQDDYIIMRCRTCYLLSYSSYVLASLVFVIYVCIVAFAYHCANATPRSFGGLAVGVIAAEIVTLSSFIYHIQRPVSFTYNGHKYTRINACLKKQLATPFDSFIDRIRLPLFAFGIVKVIIIAKCKETGDIKVQCPYCKHIMNVEDVPYRCPKCNKRMHDNVWYVLRF